MTYIHKCKNLEFKVEYEVYNKLKKTLINFEIFCGPKFLKKNIHGYERWRIF